MTLHSGFKITFDTSKFFKIGLSGHFLLTKLSLRTRLTRIVKTNKPNFKSILSSSRAKITHELVLSFEISQLFILFRCFRNIQNKFHAWVGLVMVFAAAIETRIGKVFKIHLFYCMDSFFFKTTKVFFSASTAKLCMKKEKSVKIKT